MAHTSALLGYHFVARGPELRIEHEFVEPIVVRLSSFAFTVEPPSDERAELLPGAEPRDPVSFELCDAGNAAEHIRSVIRARWRRRVPLPPLPIVRGHLLAARTRGLRDVNPVVHAVQRAVLAVSPSVPRLACDPAFFEEPYLARDVTQYRAAAIALARLEEDLFVPWCRRRGRSIHASPAALQGAMREWRGLFSVTGQPYRSLNRTLMNLPRDVPAELVAHLRTFPLERPLTDGTVLTAVLLHVSDRRAARRADVAEGQRKILERSTPGEIENAVAAIGAYTGRALSVGRVHDLGFAVRFLIDYPEAFEGRLSGLVARTVRWHDDLRDRARRPARAPRPAPEAPARVAAPFPPRRLAIRRPRPTAHPPIPLPTDGRIEFLASVERIHAEARTMDNCIASYASSAVSGHCYLFHIHYRDEHASVEVDPLGHVRQAEGPSNSMNRAADWGAQRLAEWGQRLRAPRRHVPTETEVAAYEAAVVAARVPAQLGLW